MAPAATPTFDGWPVTPANPNGTLIESMETTVSSLPPLQFPAWPRRFHRLGGEVEVRLPEALARSKNVPAVQLFKLVGGHEVEAWARRLGITRRTLQLKLKKDPPRH